MIQKINKELLILGTGRIAQVIIMLITIRISTALLLPSEMGNLYLIVSICSFFSLFLISPIGQYINRKTHVWHHSGVLLNKLFNYNYYVLLASILSFFVVLLIHSLGIADNIDYTLLLIFIPLFIFFNTWNQTIIPMINILGNRIAFTLLTIFTLLLSSILSYFIITTYKNDGILWFFGQTIGLGTLAVVAGIYFIYKIENKLNIVMAHTEITRASLKNILSFSLPLSIAAFFLWMQTQSYRLIIEKNIGVEFLGYFGVGMAIAMAISTSFETIILQFISPDLYKYMNDKTKFKVFFSNILNIILPIYFLLAIFVSFMAMYLTTILVDKQYASSYIFVIFGIWIEFFRMSSGLLSAIAHSELQTKTLIIPYAIGGIFVALGTYIVSQAENYTLYIPSVLLLGGCLTFFLIFFKMNKLMLIDLKITNFIQISPSILGFSLAILLYNYSIYLYASILITFLFGIFFLFVIYKFLKNSQDK